MLEILVHRCNQTDAVLEQSSHARFLQSIECKRMTIVVDSGRLSTPYESTGQYQMQGAMHARQLFPTLLSLVTIFRLHSISQKSRLSSVAVRRQLSSRSV